MSAPLASVAARAPRRAVVGVAALATLLIARGATAQSGPSDVRHAARAAADPLALTRDDYAARRAALAARLPDSATVVVALGAREPVNDYESFSQSPDFRWLTGFLEPGAALVMVKRGADVASTLFVLPSDPAREVWTGRRAGVTGAAAETGMAARPAAELRTVVDSLLALGLPLSVVGDVGGGAILGVDAQIVAMLRRAHPESRVVPAAAIVAELRGRKTEAELARIQRAVDVTVRAQREAMRLIEPGLNEFEVQALIEYTFRRNGAERPSFATIVGSGPNATTLHYGEDDRVMRDGELVVMDIGASYAGYAADVTRTVPVSGRFTPDQRAVYQIVRDAQRAAERTAVLGARWSDVSDSARRTIAAGLARLGLVDAPDATYECGPTGAMRCSQVGLYYMHGLGHGIGLEVHDPDQSVPGGVIAPGSAFTIEPGIYVRENLVDIVPATAGNAAFRARVAPVVKRFANVGVRIEDDYVATASGVEWISRAPREAAEVEAAMRERWAGPGARDRAVVEGYRRQ